MPVLTIHVCRHVITPGYATAPNSVLRDPLTTVPLEGDYEYGCNVTPFSASRWDTSFDRETSYLCYDLVRGGDATFC